MSTTTFLRGANEVTWVFCADESSLKTYYLAKDGDKWTAYGKPSTPVAPVTSLPDKRSTLASPSVDVAIVK